jgi:hypothetical protein
MHHASMRFLGTAVVVGGLVTGWTVASATKAPAAIELQRFAAEFPDGTREFCTDGSLVNVSYPVLDPEFEGFDTPEAAADAFVENVRYVATAPDAQGGYVYLLREALEPATRFIFNSDSAFDGGITAFDLDNEGDRVLEARLLVETLPNERFTPTDSYICDSALVDQARSIADYYRAVGVKP